MMSIQLGGVLVKEINSLYKLIDFSKFTVAARYRGTKVDRTARLFGQFGWHRE
ncbi:hypothetical protein [Cohnella sp. WQ 127256]|uniref:hypothetical protein n=1 Tax=Cohnella sp. WQ 127256 TaxID=2938790 RepID=UPI002117CE88|nr:hypothetical protein [Cohnella sp. WQ 127256]